MEHPFDLHGRTALITGANKGIGQGIAVSLAAAGANIIIVGRSAMTETADAVRRLDRECLCINADLGRSDAINGILGGVNGASRGVDILVNNAGTIARNDAVDFTEDDWDSVMDLNLKSVFFLSQAVGRLMLKRGGGKIINIASMLSFQGGVRTASYTASKSGVAGLTRLLANEWAGQGINVNAIAPGYIETDNTRPLRDDPQRSREILGRIPAAAWGKPADIGGAAVFLASDAARYVHGAILPVDGGWLAR